MRTQALLANVCIRSGAPQNPPKIHPDSTFYFVSDCDMIILGTAPVLQRYRNGSATVVHLYFRFVAVYDIECDDCIQWVKKFSDDCPDFAP